MPSQPPFNFQYKIWLKASAEQSFLYGHNVQKNGLGRITDNTPQHQGVVVYSMSDVPLVFWCVSCSEVQGFGVTAKSTAECRAADPAAIVVYHQADIGEVGICLLWLIL